MQEKKVDAVLDVDWRGIPAERVMGLRSRVGSPIRASCATTLRQCSQFWSWSRGAVDPLDPYGFNPLSKTPQGASIQGGL
jgi:hypothetical protein